MQIYIYLLELETRSTSAVLREDLFFHPVEGIIGNYVFFFIFRFHMNVVFLAAESGPVHSRAKLSTFYFHKLTQINQ